MRSHSSFALSLNASLTVSSLLTSLVMSCGFKLHLLRWCFSRGWLYSDFSLEPHIHITNCLCDVSTWMTIRHLKFVMPQTELLILCPEYAPSAAFPISEDLALLCSNSGQEVCSYYYCLLSLSHADLQFTSKLTWLYLPNITRSRSFLSPTGSSHPALQSQGYCSETSPLVSSWSPLRPYWLFLTLQPKWSLGNFSPCVPSLLKTNILASHWACNESSGS